MRLRVVYWLTLTPQQPSTSHNASSLQMIQWLRSGDEGVWAVGRTAVSTERVRRGRCSLRATMAGNEGDVTDGLHVGGLGGAEGRSLWPAWGGVTRAHPHTLGASVTLGYWRPCRPGWGWPCYTAHVRMLCRYCCRGLLYSTRTAAVVMLPL